MFEFRSGGEMAIVGLRVDGVFSMNGKSSFEVSVK